MARRAVLSAEDSLDQVTDGRVARRGRNRSAVIDAVVELFSEDNLQPGPNEVAQRCGLSPKSVRRYFEDGDALLSAAIQRQLELIYPLYHIHAIGQGPLEGRIERFVSARLKAHEAISATARAAILLAMTNTEVRKNLDRVRLLMRDQIGTHFAIELGGMTAEQRDTRVAAIDALLQFEALDYYRLRRGFSLRTTRSMLVDTFSGLLTE